MQWPSPAHATGTAAIHTSHFRATRSRSLPRRGLGEGRRRGATLPRANGWYSLAIGMVRGVSNAAHPGKLAAIWIVPVALAMTPASARAEAVISDFSAPSADCPGLATLNDRIVALAGEGAVAARGIRVLITRSGEGYRTEVRLSEADARPRVFETASCAAGIEAAALAIALGSQSNSSVNADWSVNPEPTAAVPVSSAAGRSPRAASPSPQASFGPSLPTNSEREPRAAVPSHRPSPPVTVRWSIGLGFDATALPRAAGTMQLGLSLAWRERFWFEALTLGALPQEAQAAQGSGRARFQLFAGAVHGCYLLPAAHFAVGPCLGMSASLLSGRGEDVTNAHSHTQLYAGPSAGLLGRWEISSAVSLRAALETSAPLRARPFDLNGARLHAPGKIDLFGAVGPDFRF